MFRLGCFRQALAIVGNGQHQFVVLAEGADVYRVGIRVFDNVVEGLLEQEQQVPLLNGGQGVEGGEASSAHFHPED